MSENILKREEIDNKYKWDLSLLCKDNAEFLKQIKKIEVEIPEILQFKGKLNERDDLLECFKFNSKISRVISQLYSYAMQKSDENTKDVKALANLDRIGALYSKFSVVSAYIMPELNSLDESYLNNLLVDEDFSSYDVDIKEIIRAKKYTLSEKEELILAKGEEMFGSFSDIFSMTNNADLKFPKIKDENGELQELSHSNYGMFMSSDNREVRKNAYEKYYNEFKKLIHTISATYIGNVKKDVFLSRARGFDSCLDRAMFNENADKKVYVKLLENLKKAMPSMHEYIEFRKKAMGLEEICFYDLHVSLVQNDSLKVTYEKAYEIVKTALQPLGEEYVKTLGKAYDEGWIDVFNNEGKRSGAYSNSVYDVHPYVLLNYEKTVHDVFTIAHEMGHAMHSYYSNKAQVYEKADYTIFVAEVASTVNEVLLLRHLIDNSTDVEMKKFCLNYFLDMFRTTVFRQTMFAEFEFMAHDCAENDVPLTYEMLSDEYESLNKKYYGDTIIHDDCIKYEWLRIPHFYRSFYVYKYATGFISAISIAFDILKKGDEFVAKYKEFLSSGCCLPPVELLKIADVDLTCDKPFDKAMNVFKETLKELEELI